MKKKIRVLAVVLILSLLFVTGCSSPMNKETKLSGYTVVYPERISGALHNPGMGWISLEEQTGQGKMDLGANGELPEIDNIGIQTSWALLEPSPDVYDWSLIDKTIEYWSARGKRINFRICTDSLSLPEVYFGAPQWIYEAPYNVKYKLYAYSSTVNQTRVTDVTDPVYQERFEKFMQKLSERYAGNAYLDSIDIRGFGQWGEWHSGYEFEDMKERESTLAYIIDKYAESFTDKGQTLFLSCSWDFQGYNEDGSSAIIDDGVTTYDEYVSWSAFDYAMKIDNLGWRRDGGAGNGVVKYAYDERLMSDFYRSGKKTAQCGEFFAGYDSYLPSGEGIYPYDMDPVEATDEILFKMHANYCTVMGWVNTEVANIIDNGDAEVFNRGNEIMGYRLAVDKAYWPEKISSGQNITVMTQLSNSGTGRFALQDHALKISITDKSGREMFSAINKDFDLRTLISGEVLNVYTELSVPEDFKTGNYFVNAAIVDKNGNNAVRLAQEGDYDRKIYALGGITAVKKAKSPKAAFNTSESLSDVILAKNKVYQITFQYTPSLALSDYKFGDSDSFKLQTEDGQTIASWQDVSGETSYKTVILRTGSSKTRLKLLGTGVYSGKISGGKVYSEEIKNGFFETFENYDLYSTKSPVYGTLDDSAEIVEGMMETEAVFLDAGGKRQKNNLLQTDSKLLKFEPNTHYTVNFDFLSARAGGNGAYMYLALEYGGGQTQTVAEWYNRPDEGQMNKTFSFITPDSSDCSLVFGMKNRGAYLIDNLFIFRGHKGDIESGTDIPAVNNQRPVYQDKGVGFTENFESNNMGSIAMTYGVNRLGSLTSDPNEVIEGKVSFSSRIDTFAIPFYKNGSDCWIEFSYSNPRFLSLKPNTVYRVSFSYNVLERPESAPGASDGNFYALLRSQKLGYAEDTKTIEFGSQETNGVETFTADFITGDSDDYRLILGMYHYGVLVYDNFIVTELGTLENFDGFIDFESGNAGLSNVELNPYSAKIVSTADYAVNNEFFMSAGEYSLLCEASPESWNEYMQIAANFKIKKNTKYRVTYDYYIVDAVGGAFIQSFMRPSSGYMDDASGPNFRVGNIKSGDFGTYSETFSTSDKDNYRWIFGSFSDTTVLIDNISIVEVV